MILLLLVGASTGVVLQAAAMRRWRSRPGAAVVYSLPFAALSIGCGLADAFLAHLL